MKAKIIYYHGKDNPFEKSYNINGLLVGLTSNGWLLQDIYYKNMEWCESYLIKASKIQLQVIQHIELKSNIYSGNII